MEEVRNIIDPEDNRILAGFWQRRCWHRPSCQGRQEEVEAFCDEKAHSQELQTLKILQRIIMGPLGAFCQISERENSSGHSPNQPLNFRRAESEILSNLGSDLTNAS